MKLSTFHGHLTINVTSQAQKNCALSHKPYPVTHVRVHITHTSDTRFMISKRPIVTTGQERVKLKKKMHSMVTKNH